MIFGCEYLESAGVLQSPRTELLPFFWLLASNSSQLCCRNSEALMNLFHAPTIIAALLLAAATPLALAAQQTPPPSRRRPALHPPRSPAPPCTANASRCRLGAVFTATLEDTSRADAPSTRIAQFTKKSPGNPPIRFTITYDPSKIIDSHTYTVRATITVEGRLMFTSTTSNPVLTGGKPDHVAFTLHHVTAADDLPPSPRAPAPLPLRSKIPTGSSSRSMAKIFP